MVVEENRRQNLMSKPSEGAIRLRHLADSAQLMINLSEHPAKTSPWLDLGPFGAGPITAIAVIVLPIAQLCAVFAVKRWATKS